MNRDFVITYCNGKNEVHKYVVHTMMELMDFMDKFEEPIAIFKIEAIPGRRSLDKYYKETST